MNSGKIDVIRKSKKPLQFLASASKEKLRFLVAMRKIGNSSPDLMKTIFELQTLSSDELDSFFNDLKGLDSPLSETVRVVYETVKDLSNNDSQEKNIFDFENQIKAISLAPVFVFGLRTIIIRLNFLASDGRPLLTSDQDLEDTLFLGQSLCDGVETVISGAIDAGISFEKISLGGRFEKHLSSLEDSIKAIRKRLKRKPGSR